MKKRGSGISGSCQPLQLADTLRMSEVAVKEVKGEVQDPSEINPLLLDSEGAISDQVCLSSPTLPHLA